jgi:TonB-dependent starch-binding outer membrane protein SusC
MRRILLLAMGILLLCTHVYAQNRTISGKVTDQTGAPVPNASILIKGSSIGTTSKTDGSFSLTIPPAAQALIISAVGMTDKEVAIGSSDVLDISMQALDKNLTEVVVVGYQTQSKREVTAAIAKVAGADIENLPLQSFDRAIQGRATGVAIRSSNGIPGGAVNVRIRGTGSITAGNDPLYIVDGVQLNSNTVSFGQSFTQTNPLSYLNPNDIESIEILKDAAAAAIYGARAGNGVIIITTKKGKAGKTSVLVSSYYGITNPLKKMDVLSTQEYIQARSEAYANQNNLADINTRSNALRPSGSGVGYTAEMRVLSDMGLDTGMTKGGIAGLPTYDWQDEAFRQGQVQDIQVSLTSGGEKTSFYLSGSYNKTDAIVIPADFERATLLANIGHKFNSKLTIETQISLSSILQGGTFSQDGSFLGSPSFSSSLILPHNPIYNADGTFAGLPPGAVNGVLNQNVVGIVNFNTSTQNTKQIVGSISATYEVAKGLRYKGLFGIDYRMAQARRFTDPRTNDGFAVVGRLTEVFNWNTNYITSHTLNYMTSFNAMHNINALVGLEYRSDVNEQTSAQGIGFPTPQFRTLNSAATPEAVGGQWTASTTFSQFGKINYDYDKKYLLSFTLRRDGSSRFGANNLYGVFPSVSAGWNLTAERFMEKISFINDLKLRVSYGQTGNDQIGNFQSRSLYGSTRTYAGSAAITPTQLGNADLAWERREEWNAGLDFAFLQNRISGSFDVYKRDNNELLLDRPLYSATGFTVITQNVGAVRNTGVELGLRVRVLDGDFKWVTNFNISYNDNQVTGLYDTLKSLPSDNSISIGHPLGSFFVNPYAGVNPATGRAMWYDINGNITYSALGADRRFMGTTLPAYTGGFGNTFSYKYFELDVFFNYEYGRTVSDGQLNFLSEIGGRAFNALQEVYDRRWTKPGDITDVPRPYNGNAEVRGSGNFTGSRVLLKADYIRLKQITLSYNLPPSLTRRMGLNAAKFYVQGINLWTYDDFPGYDPEFGATSTGIIPTSKNMTVGVQVGF